MKVKCALIKENLVALTGDATAAGARRNVLMVRTSASERRIIWMGLRVVPI